MLRITLDKATNTFTFHVGKKVVDNLTYAHMSDSAPPESCKHAT